MMRLMAVVSGMLLFVSVANAEPSSLVAFDLPTIQLLRTADTARGEALAEEGKCDKCHGDTGVSDDPDDVNIAGLRASYIYKQLKDYQAKNREPADGGPVRLVCFAGTGVSGGGSQHRSGGTEAGVSR